MTEIVETIELEWANHFHNQMIPSVASCKVSSNSNYDEDRLRICHLKPLEYRRTLGRSFLFTSILLLIHANPGGTYAAHDRSQEAQFDNFTEIFISGIRFSDGMPTSFDGFVRYYSRQKADLPITITR
uniref:Uncharacterized protein n=1 Tax=Ascaris lumbricoides TaxID=6252 RepID=A0A0M3IHX6_ASCLU